MSPLPLCHPALENEMMLLVVYLWQHVRPRARGSMDTETEALCQKGHESSSMSADGAALRPRDLATGALAPPPLPFFSPDGTNRILSTFTSREVPFLPSLPSDRKSVV